MTTRTEGIIGESIAKEYLENSGYGILETNFSAKTGEIDIIAYKNETVIFVEVKRRNQNEYGYGLESVTPDKIRKIVKTAEIYLLSKGRFDAYCRFDVITVNDREIVEHIKNAFTKQDPGRKKHW